MDVATIAPPRAELRLDLGCGLNPRPGFTGVDLYAPGAYRQDLMRFPWVWADESVAELHCSHFVEHLPMVYVDAEGGHSPMPSPGSVDLFIAFFNECWRILAPGGSIKVCVPAAQSNRAYQDPTHRRFLTMESFLYLHRPFREANGLEHYLGATCNFDAHVVCGVGPVELARSPEVQAVRSRTLWNVVQDWHATLIKPEAPTRSGP